MSSIITCNAIKRNGTSCQYKAKYNDKCGYHREDGYHKCKVKRIVETRVDNLVNIINDLRAAVDIMQKEIASHLGVISYDVHCNASKLDNLIHTLLPVLAPLRVATNTASRIPIVGRFVK